MLKITTEHATEGIKLRLDGKLKGPWVEELARTWRAVMDAAGRPAPIVVDLSGVTFVDGEGKRLLSRMCAEGADFRTSGCMTRGIIEQIRHICQCGGEPESGSSTDLAGERRNGAAKL